MSLKQMKKNISCNDAKQLLNDCIGRITEGIEKVNWADADTYAAWLSQTYGYTQYTTRFVAFSAGRCSLEQESLFTNLLHGLNEEKGHHLLVIRDLQALGREISEFPEIPQTSAFHQTLFRNVDLHGPMAILGYSMPLEGMAATGLKSTLRIVKNAYGDEGTNFLRAHAELDEGHFTDAMAFLQGMGADDLAVVYRHMELSTGLYLGILNAIPALARETGKTHGRAAA